MNINQLYLSSGILEKWHDKTWDDMTNCDEAKDAVLHYLNKYKEAKKDGVGLFLFGSNGTGKSLLMNLAFKDLIEKRNTVHIITLSTLITKFTSSWYNEQDRDELYGHLLNVDFLGIEEIGKEFKSSTDLSAVVLDSIIKYRIQRNMAVWATSNVRPTEVTNTYTEDIASMMKEACIPVQVTGNDMRDVIKKKIKNKFL